MLQRLIAVFILFISLLIPQYIGSAQNTVEFGDLAAFYKYGDQITFQAEVQPVNLLKDLTLIIQPEGQTRIQEKIKLEKSGEIIFIYDLSHNPIQPFSQVTYWYIGITTSGSTVESSHESFTYEENLTEWKRLEEDRFTVSWHEGDEFFGKAALGAARAGLHAVSAYLPLVAPPSIRIYIYKNARDLQTALLSDQNTWVAGHTNPELKVILVSIPPGTGQQSEMERQIPHEIAHIVIFQLAGASGYRRLPTWLSEGLASQAELTPNSDYAKALERAARSNQLIPLESLCDSFPSNASSAYLAYAQSASFVQFYFKQYGSSGLVNLINQYLQVANCTEGVQSAAGTSLANLDARWQQNVLGLFSSSLAMQELSPFFLLGLILLLIPLSVMMIFSFKKQAKG